MKKKKKLITLALILIIAIVAIIIIMFQKRNKEKISKLNDIYNDLSSKQTYMFSMSKNDNEKIIMAKKDDQTVIDQYSDNSHTTTLVKDGNTYLILHDRQEYYVYKNNNIEQTILIDGIQELLQKEYTTEKEKIFGKKYTYEEYTGSTVFILTNLREVKEEDIKTRFYFDKNDNLKYIKTIYAENDEELLNVEVSYEPENSIFEIPSNYAEN